LFSLIKETLRATKPTRGFRLHAAIPSSWRFFRNEESSIARDASMAMA
jgi:hypothetical protein